MATKVTLNDEQKEAFKAIQRFIEHPAADTFVLKGYAGTGKTFLMQYLARWLNEHSHNFNMLASTGRAATVLRGKTGFEANTVHGELYRFSKVEGDEEDIEVDAPVDKYGQMTLRFALRPADEGKKVYIVDEASMLSSEMSPDSDQLSFGSGQLLPDFFDAVGSNKIIFVGDPGQLPPVGQTFSPALDMSWLAEQRRTAISITLEKIERNDADNDILVLASMIRNMVPDPTIRYPKLPAANLNNVKLYNSEVEQFNSYLQKFKEVGASGTLAVARSNKIVNQINRAVRRDLFGGELDLPIQVGDILMVVQNNHAVPLANGDFVEVLELGENRTRANLKFQNIRIKTLLSGSEYELLLSLDILTSLENNFSKEQSRELMIDFSRRIKKRGFKANSPAYKDLMLKDSYLNCLKTKFGYAVTCHKAQGGEWDDVYIFLNSKIYGMPQEELFRWWYTAVTRAKKYLHLVNEWWIR